METKLVRKIMGHYFIGTQDVEQVLGERYSRKYRNQLNRVSFSEETLRACAKTHILIPGFPVTIMDMIRNTKTNLKLRTNLEKWNGANTRQTFMNTQVSVRWFLIRIEPLKFLECEHVLMEGERVTTARDAAYASVISNLVVNKVLFQNPATELQCADKWDCDCRTSFNFIRNLKECWLMFGEHNTPLDRSDNPCVFAIEPNIP